MAAKTIFTEAVYELPVQLFRAHEAETPEEYARFAFAESECGVATMFLTATEIIPSHDLTEHQNTMEWASRNLVGIQHGTIDAEFTATPLMFPFTDEELAASWDYLNDKAEQDSR